MTSERMDLGTEVELTHLRNEMTFEGSLTLPEDQREVRSLFGDGQGSKQEPETETLSQIVTLLNDRFGTNFSQADQLFFDQVEEECTSDAELVDQARSNTLDNFRLPFDRRFLGMVVARMDANEVLAKRLLDDAEFQASVPTSTCARCTRG